MDQTATYNFLSTDGRSGRFKKALIIGLILGVILLLSVFLFWRYLNEKYVWQTLPMFTDDLGFLLVLQPQSMVFQQQSTLAEILSQTLDVDPQWSIKVFSRLLSVRAEQLGLVVRNQQLYWFVKNPRFEQESEFVVDDLVMSQQYYHDQLYYFFGKQPWPHNQPRFTGKQLVVKRNLAETLDRYDNVLFWAKPPLAGDQNFYGVLRAGEKSFRLDLVTATQLLKKKLKTVHEPSGSVYLNWKQSDLVISSLAGLLFDGEVIISDHIIDNLGQASLLIEEGDLVSFIQNPYQSELTWRLEKDLNDAQDTKVLVAILDDLSRRFPLIIERVLPDQSVILELKQDRRVFFQDQSLLDDQGKITYSQGQISFIKRSGKIFVQKGNLEASGTVENTCIVDNAIMQAHMNLSQHDLSMWKNLNLSYNQQHLAICFIGF